MSESKKLLRNTLIYSIGNFGSRIFSFLLVPLYSFYLSKEELGYYDLIITSVTLVSPFITLQMSDAAYRWVLESKDNFYKQSKYISTSFYLILFNIILFLAIIFLMVTFFFQIVYVSYFIFTTFSGIALIYFQQLARGLGKNKLYSLSGIANTIMLVIFTVLFVVIFKLKVSGLFLSVILANFFTMIIVFFRSKIYQYISIKFFDKKESITMLKYAWPLVPNAISWWLINEINRFIILYYLGVNANGIFALAARFPSIILAVNSIFMLSWQDHILAGEEKDNFYSKVFKSYMILEFTMVILLSSVSMYAVHYSIDKAFFEAWKYMPFLYLGVAFSSFAAFIGTGYLKQKQTGGIFFTSIAGSIVNLLISVLLIKKIGLFAPAIGTFAGFITMWVIRVKKMKSVFKIRIDYKLFFFLLLSSFVCIWLVFLKITYINIIVIILSVFLFFFLNRQLIQYFLQFISKSNFFKKLRFQDE